MPQDPFELLSLPPRFDLAPADIRRAWLARAADVHPDHAASPNDEHARLAAALNHARRALEDPERRADALLLRLNGPAREQEKSLPDGFLVEMLAVREEMEEARAAGASTERFHRWADDRRAEHIGAVARMFSSLDTPPAPDALRAIRIELNAWRYIERMIEQLDPNADAGPFAADRD